MKTVAQLKAELDAANILVKREFAKAIRSGKGPSADYKAAFANARTCWKAWCFALDSAEGVKLINHV